MDLTDLTAQEYMEKVYGEFVRMEKSEEKDNRVGTVKRKWKTAMMILCLARGIQLKWCCPAISDELFSAETIMMMMPVMAAAWIMPNALIMKRCTRRILRHWTSEWKQQIREKIWECYVPWPPKSGRILQTACAL